MVHLQRADIFREGGRHRKERWVSNVKDLFIESTNYIYTLHIQRFILSVNIKQLCEKFGVSDTA